MASFPVQLQYSKPKLLKVAPTNASSQLVVDDALLLDHHLPNPYLACDDEIPTIDYSMLFSTDDDQQFLALQYLRSACQKFGFFYLINHTVPDKVIDNVLKGVSNFFDSLTLEEKEMYGKKGPSDRVRWELFSSCDEDREALKVTLHPHFQAPTKPEGFSKSLEDYGKEIRKVEYGLAKAMSTTLGLEENYIEKALKLNSGFDVMHANRYPPKSISKAPVGLAEHVDPGFIITLIQDVDGGLQILPHNGNWINCYIPPHAILIQLGDQLEILTNGKYKSHLHRVIIDNNKEKRTSIAILHGPSMNTFISPGTEFVDDEHSQRYQAMTYKEYLESNGHETIAVTSSLEHIRLPKLI